MVVGLICSWCGLWLDFVALMYFNLSDLEKLLKLLSRCNSVSVGEVLGVGEKVSPLSSSWWSSVVSL